MHFPKEKWGLIAAFCVFPPHTGLVYPRSVARSLEDRPNDPRRLDTYMQTPPLKQSLESREEGRRPGDLKWDGWMLLKDSPWTRLQGFQIICYVSLETRCKNHVLLPSLWSLLIQTERKGPESDQPPNAKQNLHLTRPAWQQVQRTGGYDSLRLIRLKFN